MAAISGIEHTLWDISAKALGLPVYRLLGGRVRDRVRVYEGCSGPTPEKAAEKAAGLIEQYGYTALKMSPFPPDDHLKPWNEVLREGPKHMAAVREAVGDDVDIGLDVHAKVFEPMPGPWSSRGPSSRTTPSSSRSPYARRASGRWPG